MITSMCPYWDERCRCKWRIAEIQNGRTQKRVAMRDELTYDALKMRGTCNKKKHNVDNNGHGNVQKEDTPQIFERHTFSF